MPSPLRGGAPAAEVAEAPPRCLEVQSPTPSLKSTLAGDLPITQNAIAAAQTAGASPTLLRKAFRKRQKTAPSPAPQQLELDGGATPKPKPSKPVLHSALAGLRQVRPEDLPCSGDKRKDLKRKGLAAATMATKEAAKIAAAGVEKAAKNAASAASAAAQGSGAGDDGDGDSDDRSSGPGGSSTKKRKRRGEHSCATKKC